MVPYLRLYSLCDVTHYLQYIFAQKRCVKRLAYCILTIDKPLTLDHLLDRPTACTMSVNGYPVPVTCKCFGIGVFGHLKSLSLQSVSQQRTLCENLKVRSSLQIGVLLV